MAAKRKEDFTRNELGMPPWQDQSISPKSLSKWSSGSKEICDAYDTFSAPEKFMSQSNPQWTRDNPQAELRVNAYKVIKHHTEKNIGKFVFQVRLAKISSMLGYCLSRVQEVLLVSAEHTPIIIMPMKKMS
jgi:hypothetical protein